MEFDASGNPVSSLPSAPPSPAGSAANAALITGTCPVCHQPVTAQDYFCPNCGANLHSKPLSTDPAAQAGLYAFSVILPMLCFLFVNKWKGIAYYRSNDPKTKQIGVIAILLLTLSTALTIYLAIVWTQEAIQSQVNAINEDLG